MNPIDYYFSKANNGVWATPATLDSVKGTGDNTADISIATGWPVAATDGPVHFKIFKTEVVDDKTVVVEDSVSDWKGLLSGNTLSEMTCTGGNNQDYVEGDSIAIYPTAAWGNSLIEGILTHANQDGTLKDGSVYATEVLADLIVTAAKIAANAVTSDKIAANAVTPDKRTGGYKMIQYTFSASGSVQITGVGFKPKAVIINGMISTSSSQNRQSKGMAAYDGAAITQGSHATFTQSGVYQSVDDRTAAFLSINSSGGVTFKGVITSFDNDGITVNVNPAGSFSLDKAYDILFMG